MRALRSVILLVVYAVFLSSSAFTVHVSAEAATESMEKEVFQAAFAECRTGAAIKISGKSYSDHQHIKYENHRLYSAQAVGEPHFSSAHLHAVPIYVLHCSYLI